LLSRLLGAPVSAWRWPLIWAAAAGAIVGRIMIELPEWAELLFGIPAILAAFGAVLWTRGFGPGDRELFRMNKAEVRELQLPDPSTGGDAPR
jgi:signal transduction histidine kinase